MLFKKEMSNNARFETKIELVLYQVKKTSFNIVCDIQRDAHQT